MKTFEEQFTAWTDDQLPAGELAAFERELAARPDADALRAEKRLHVHLGELLRENVTVPTLSNPDFFNHGILERIAAEDRAAAVATAPRRSWWQWDWTPARLLAAGAACLLTALVGVRALIPTGNNAPTPSSPQPTIVQNDPAPKVVTPPTPVEPAVEAPRGPGSKDDGVVARNDVQPPSVPVPDPAPPAPPVAPPPPAPPVTATPLHFKEDDVDVIWLDGADYLPSLDDGAASPAPGPVVPAVTPR